MIAMQYSFVLPADYDMGIVDRRIAEKGPSLDNFPNLKFKAYLTARRADAGRSRENLYAPFYVWDHADGLNDFVCVRNRKRSSRAGVFSGAPFSFQSGTSSFNARGSMTAPDRM